MALENDILLGICLPFLVVAVIGSIVLVIFVSSFLSNRERAKKWKGKAGTDDAYFVQKLEELVKGEEESLSKILPSVSMLRFSIGEFMKSPLEGMADAEIPLYLDSGSSDPESNKPAAMCYLAMEAAMLSTKRNITMNLKSADLNLKLLMKDSVGEVFRDGKLIGTIDTNKGEIRNKKDKVIANFIIPDYVVRNVDVPVLGSLPTTEPSMNVVFGKETIKISLGSGSLFLNSLDIDEDKKALLLALALPVRFIFYNPSGSSSMGRNRHLHSHFR
jgi:hypothetical protein